jgi:hypothetical protein
MAHPKIPHLKTDKYKAVGKRPYGFDSYRDEEGQAWFVPHKPTIDLLAEAIDHIRSGRSVRTVSAWLEDKTKRKLSATRLHKLAWTEEELAERRKDRRKNLTPKQRKIEDLKNVEKQTRIKSEQAKRRLERARAGSGIQTGSEPESFSDAGQPLERDIAFRPNPGPQTDFLAANEREVFYGGARGGGKTYSLLIAPLRFVDKPTSRALLIRRSMPELRDVIFQTQQLYPKAVPGAKFKTQENTWHFPGGARIEFGYCENLQDVLRYQGQSYSWIGVDELPQYDSPDVWYFLRSSLRSADPSIPLHMRATGNPGNRGSRWVKELFIEPCKPNTRFSEKVEYELEGRTLSTEITRKFIPASVWDNPYLTQDSSYIAMLASLPEVKRKQFLYGDWDVVEDGAFSEFNRSTHVVEPFEVPNGWTRIRAADFGFSSPSAILWGAVDYDNNIWIYRELYISKVTADQLGRMIREVESGDGKIYDAVLDSSCWARRGDRGPSIAEMLNAEGCRFRPSDRSPGSRISGKIEIHKRLMVDEDTEEPRLRIFENCPNLIRQLSSLPLDKNNPEDVDTKAEDHAYDALRYMVSSRPTNIRTAFENMPKTTWRPSDNRFGY